MIGLQIFLYYSLFPPLVYLVFMAKFFQTAEHWPLTSGRAGWFSGDRQECSNEDDQRRQKRRRELQQWMIEQEQQSERRQVHTHLAFSGRHLEIYIMTATSGR